MGWHDLSEHTGTLIALLGFIATIAGVLFYRLINSMDKKIDDATVSLNSIRDACGARREKCSEDFVHRKDFDENWRPGRNGPDGLWAALNKHSHEGILGEGKVIRK